MSSPIEQFFNDHGLTQSDVAVHLGVDRSAVSRKVAGDRPWKQSEIEALMALATQRLGRRVTYEELFGRPEEATPPVTGSVDAGFPEERVCTSCGDLFQVGDPERRKRGLGPCCFDRVRREAGLPPAAYEFVAVMTNGADA